MSTCTMVCRYSYWYLGMRSSPAPYEYVHPSSTTRGPDGMDTLSYCSWSVLAVDDTMKDTSPQHHLVARVMMGESSSMVSHCWCASAYREGTPAEAIHGMAAVTAIHGCSAVFHSLVCCCTPRYWVRHDEWAERMFCKIILRAPLSCQPKYRDLTVM